MDTKIRSHMHTHQLFGCLVIFFTLPLPLDTVCCTVVTCPAFDYEHMLLLHWLSHVFHMLVGMMLNKLIEHAHGYHLPWECNAR